MPTDPLAWSALFLTAVSPGQVVRLLERLHAPAPAGGLLLSDPAGPRSLRALVAPEASRATLEALAPLLAVGLQSPVTSVYQDAAERRWGHAVHAPEAPMERADGDWEPPAPRPFLARIVGGASTPSPAVAWAEAHDLPLTRVPAYRPKGSPRILGYETVARLDQKKLLVENTPRLYWFDLGGKAAAR